MSNQLPNFLVIGAAKCGTTSLHRYLGQHPDIFMPRHKEIHFFLADQANWGTWNRGLKWYESLFAAARDQKMRGEASPGYTIDPHTDTAARKIRNVLGSPKLIYFVREPISRLKSHYLESYYGYGPNIEPGLDDIISNRGRPDEEHYGLYCDYVKTSLYNRQLEKILHYHKQEDVFIRTQEEFSSTRTQVMADAFQFLGVDPSFANLLNGDDRNITAGKRKRVRDPVKPLRASRWYPAVSAGLPELVKRGYRIATSVTVSNEELTQISDENMDHLRSIFTNDTGEFHRVTGVQLAVDSDH